jgi:mono/diheme cytochrome c family protein
MRAALLGLALAGAAFTRACAADPAGNGEYLTRAADCAACHTVPGGHLFAGGRAFVLPFGTIYAPNITPDPKTGIGGYSDDDWVRMLQKGIGRGGRHLYPAMPYDSYAKMTRADALAIKAYLFSVAPIAASAPENHVKFPFDQRWGLVFWNMLEVSDRPLTADPAKSAAWNRGAYLVEAMGHCGECHTPRNAIYGLKGDKALAGAKQDGWLAYNLTSDKTAGLGGWSDAQLAEYLLKGEAPGHGPASGPMAEAVEYSLRYMTPEDIAAIVAYLRDVPAQPDGPAAVQARAATVSGGAAVTPAALTGADAETGLGRHIYMEACAGCHLPNGAGRQSPWAALAGSHTAGDPDGTNLVEILAHGSQIETEDGLMFMHSFTGGYTDRELAAAANFLIAQTSGRAGRVTPAQIAAQRGPDDHKPTDPPPQAP